MRKTISVFAITIIALMIASVSYAMWSKALNINGQVNTGYMDAKWTVVTNHDQGLDPKGPNEFWDKDVASTTFSGIGTDTLVITVNNAYPSYFNDLQIEYEYTGTIPAILKEIKITPVNFHNASSYGANDGEIWIEVVDGIGSKFHQGDTGASSLKFHIEQCAEQGTTYTFTIEFVFVQWNEA